MVNFTLLLENANTWLITKGPGILIALITLFIGWKLIGFFMRVLEKTWKKKFDPSLRHFLERLISISLKVLLLVSVAANLGFQTTSFVAIIGAAGLAVGLALQGSLGNFAGGVLILMFKPFKVGDYIGAQGEEGVVKHIDIFNTILTTIDNKTVILPNGNVSNGTIINYTKEPTRGVHLTIGVSYDDDVKKVEKVLRTIAEKHPKILKEPAPFIRLGEFGADAVNFTVRVRVNTPDYWDVYFDMMDTIKYEFDKQGISFPYPQMDVHVHKETSKH